MRRVYNRIPRRDPTRTPDLSGPAIARALGLGAEVIAAASYCALAWMHHGPGLSMRARIARLAVRIAARNRTRMVLDLVTKLLLSPMDSVRYFEFDFAWSAAAGLDEGRYLDLSSPRLFPIVLLADRSGIEAEIINPDPRDLAATRELLAACGLEGASTLHRTTVEAASLAPEHFDLVTSISVVEHIAGAGDAAAVEKLWRSVRRGGRMVITVPCAREAFEEFLDVDEYGLAQADGSGFFFGQRFYDRALLEERFFGTCGAPRAIAVFGEKRAGTFFESRARNASGTGRSLRDPYAMATEYARFETMEELPGIGVVAMLFVKT